MRRKLIILQRIYTVFIICFAVISYIIKLYMPLAICFQLGLIIECWLLVLHIMEYKRTKDTSVVKDIFFTGSSMLIILLFTSQFLFYHLVFLRRYGGQ